MGRIVPSSSSTEASLIISDYLEKLLAAGKTSNKFSQAQIKTISVDK